MSNANAHIKAPLCLIIILFFTQPTTLAYHLHSNAISGQATMTSTKKSRGFVSTPLGQLHYITTGSINSTLTPILAFHMSPRSTDEYTEVMPLLSSSSNDDDDDDDGNDRQQQRLVVAIDEFGYGASDNPSRSCTLDEIADCYLLLAEELKIPSFVVTGSLMGCYFALSLASRYPDRVTALICTNLFYFALEAREAALRREEERSMKSSVSRLTEAVEDGSIEESAGSESIEDSWVLKEDGSHISNLWSKRSSWLDETLNTRVVLDELTYLVKRKERYSRGINIQDAPAFDLEGAARAIKCPVLCLQGENAVKMFSAIGMDMETQFKEAMAFFDDVEVVDVKGPGSTINLVNQKAKEWTDIVTKFLKKLDYS